MSNTDDVILDFLVPRIRQLREAKDGVSKRHSPIIVGISGCQGSGKSTVASSLVVKLSSVYNYNAAEISLDDFYLTRSEQDRLTRENPQNPLLRTRGQPGTHDIRLAECFFRQFQEENAEDRSTPLFWPSYDKSKFGGKGDRVPPDQWKKIEKYPLLDVLILEGWCVGFKPLGSAGVAERWNDAQGTNQRLASTRLEDMLLLDSQLQRYCERFMGPSQIDLFILLRVSTLETVYIWREEQERKLRRMTKGSGMTKQEVVEFGKAITRQIKNLDIATDLHSEWLYARL